jgi:hypothetical protein
VLPAAAERRVERRVDRRGAVLRKVFGAGVGYNPADLAKPRLPYVAMLHKLHRTSLTSQRVADIIKALAAGCPAAPLPPDLVTAPAGNAMQRHRFRALLETPLEWRVTDLPVARFALGDQPATPTEPVLFARVPSRTEGMASPARAPGGNAASGRWLQVLPPHRVQAALENTWYDVGKAAFRGIRTLYNHMQERYLGVSFADVDAWVRHQEVHQMLVPAAIDTYNPLVATELGWHQADIMYATWDVPGELLSETQAVTDLQKANTNADDGDVEAAAAADDDSDDDSVIVVEPRGEAGRLSAENDSYTKAVIEGVEVYLPRPPRSVAANSEERALEAEIQEVTTAVVVTAAKEKLAKTANEPSIARAKQLNEEYRAAVRRGAPAAEIARREADLDEANSKADEGITAIQALQQRGKDLKRRARALRKRLNTLVAQRKAAARAGGAGAGGAAGAAAGGPAGGAGAGADAAAGGDGGGALEAGADGDDGAGAGAGGAVAGADGAGADGAAAGAGAGAGPAAAGPAAAGPAAAGPAAAGCAIPVGRKGKYPYILNVMDIFSKYAWSFPLRDMRAETVAACLERLWLQEGAPAILQTDQGAQFTGAAVKDLARRFGVETRLCAPYRSQCTGAIERLNATIRASMRNVRLGLSLKGSQWTAVLPYVVYTYNTQRHSTTSLCPYLVQRGREPAALTTRVNAGAAGGGGVGGAGAGGGAAGAGGGGAEAGGGGAGAGGDAAEAAADAGGGGAGAGGGGAGAGGGGAEAAGAAAEAGGGAGAAGGGADAGGAEAAGVAPLTGGADTYAAVALEAYQDALAARPFDAAELAEVAALQRYRDVATAATAARTAFAQRGIRHGALGMTADALLRAEASLKPLPVGTLVRISVAHLDRKHKRALKMGVKAARDQPVWSEDVYYLVAAPPATPDAAAAASASGDERPTYVAVKVGDRDTPDARLSVPRQDLLAVTATPATPAELARLRDGDTQPVTRLVTLRPGTAAHPLTFQ